ncbi:unnamed protein product [Prorocentrum cordatum]|uniref:Uncharacterized protein n=1 Tax=Prorocentrum cordatum TaxID=2364126 RepID=A0ABN9VWC5_9DINO|nr:unnamed protein product [Polarella glacialis]
MAAPICRVCKEHLPPFRGCFMPRGALGDRPAQSGLDGPVLQTALGGGGAAGGQYADLAPGPWASLRWRLLCLGPPLRRLPAEMRPLSSGAGSGADLAEPQPAREGDGEAEELTRAGDAEFDSGSEVERALPGAVVRLRLGSGRRGGPAAEATSGKEREGSITFRRTAQMFWIPGALRAPGGGALRPPPLAQ